MLHFILIFTQETMLYKRILLPFICRFFIDLKHFNQNKMTTTRRNFLKAVGISTSGVALGASSLAFSSCAPASKEPAADDEQQLFIGDDVAIAQTEYGKVQGILLRKIYNFRGIPYGADTGGKNRFMPPQKPEPWTDIYPAVWWGTSSPQNMANKYANAMSSFADHWNYFEVGENCLKLNVWTPALADGQKRPVLVWFHGGGFTSGNGIEQDGYNGENLSRKGNIVFVSVNHRLGAIGFSDLSSVGGEKYANSGNVGALDMVAALQWVNKNIANFGGDPGNVTIMGQSGGGSKVCIITNMPAAKGLVHKVVPLSGNTLGATKPEYSQKVGEAILKEAGLKPSQIDKLQEMPWEDYLTLANKATATVAATGAARVGFSPVADGINIIKEEFFSTDISKDVPMMICTTFHEWGASRLSPEMEAMTKEAAIESLKTQGFRTAAFGDKAQAVYEAYEKVFPGAKPIEVVTLISSNRKNVIATANAKSKQSAPVYLAWFGWEPPLFNNRMRAFHCLDICFWFANTDLMLTHTGGGKRPRALSDTMSNALLNFMKTGDPNGEGVPAWPKYGEENGETMILDDVCEVLNDPDREAREMLDI